jgi:hypothetical protein
MGATRRKSGNRKLISENLNLKRKSVLKEKKIMLTDGRRRGGGAADENFFSSKITLLSIKSSDSSRTSIKIIGFSVHYRK